MNYADFTDVLVELGVPRLALETAREIRILVAVAFDDRTDRVGIEIEHPQEDPPTSERRPEGLEVVTTRRTYWLS